MHLPCRFVCIASINIKKCSCLELINPFPFHWYNSKVVRVTIHLFVAFQHSISITVFVVKLGVKSQTFNHFDISTQRELRKACTCRTIAVSGLLVAIAFFAGEEFEELIQLIVEQRFWSRKTVDSTSWRILKWYHVCFLSKVFTFWTCKWMICFHSRIWECLHFVQKIHSSDPGICGANDKGERYREPTRFTRQGDPRFRHFGSALDKKKIFRYTFAREKSSGHLHFFGFCSVGLCGHQRSALECQFELLGAMCIHVCDVVEGGWGDDSCVKNLSHQDGSVRVDILVATWEFWVLS